VSHRLKLKKTIGLALVELLVATAISIIVFSMAITLYLSAKEQFLNYKDKTSIEVKELRAKKVINDFIKSAGFACKFGYTNQAPYIDETGDSLENYFLGSGSGVRVGKLPFTETSNLTGALESVGGSEEAQLGTDYILIRTEEKHTKLTANNELNNAPSTSLSLADTDSLAGGDYLALCNKEHIDLVKIPSGSSVPTSGEGAVTLKNAPSESAYYAGDYAGKYELQILYIRDTGDKGSDNNKIYSLYAYVKEGASQGTSYELVRGVENLKVEYATISGGNIVWNTVSTDVELDSSYHAIKASFTIDGRVFSKIVIL